MPVLIFFFSPSHQIFWFLLLTNTKQGSGTHLLMLIYLLISHPHFFKACFTPRFPKYVCVVNLVSLIHTPPPGNLSSTHISSLCPRLQHDSFLTSNNRPLHLALAAVEVDRTGQMRVHPPRFTLSLFCTHPYPVSENLASCHRLQDVSWRKAGKDLSKAD